MRNIILFTLLLVSGFVSAQNYNFSCAPVIQEIKINVDGASVEDGATVPRWSTFQLDAVVDDSDDLTFRWEALGTIQSPSLNLLDAFDGHNNYTTPSYNNNHEEFPQNVVFVFTAVAGDYSATSSVTLYLEGPVGVDAPAFENAALTATDNDDGTVTIDFTVDSIGGAEASIVWHAVNDDGSLKTLLGHGNGPSVTVGTSQNNLGSGSHVIRANYGDARYEGVSGIVTTTINLD